MASAAQTASSTLDARFNYEPLFTPHPTHVAPITFAGFRFTFPLWISSMTGGAKHARSLNSRMARACGEFDLGMGLGSCRPLLDDRQSREDFAVAHLMPGRPLFANLGIAQLEVMLAQGELARVHHLVEDLQATGLIIHVNPMQEWFQPGGDLYKVAPLETITRFVEVAPYPVIVKEVGHGFGPASLRALMRLPLAAIEFGAYGGTNFSVLEARRAGDESALALTRIGHTAQDMVNFVKTLLASGESFRCENFIISGGLTDALQGYHLVAQLPRGKALFGMAHSVLREAQLGDEALAAFITQQRSHYAMAEAYLRPRI